MTQSDKNAPDVYQGPIINKYLALFFSTRYLTLLSLSLSSYESSTGLRYSKQTFCVLYDKI